MAAAGARHHGLDWLRIGAFALLIFYHIGMFFVPWDWHVKNDPVVPGFAYPMLALYTWRLPLLFVVSGFASRALLGRLGAPGAFVRSRSWRLLVPLLFGMLVVVAPQPWVELTAKHHYRIPIGDYFPRLYWSFSSIDGVELPTWNHLWFVAYLWVYSVLVAAGAALVPPRSRIVLQAAFERLLTNWRLLAFPIAYLLVVRLVLVAGKPETHGLFDDLPGHLVYLFPFLFGFGLGGAPRLWTSIRRFWRVSVALALTGLVGIIFGEIIYPGDTVPPPLALIGLRIARVINTWGMIVALLALADRYLKRDHPLRAKLAEAVFPAYLVHQTVIVVTGWLLLGSPLDWPARLAVLIVVTAAACALVYLVGRQIGWLRPLIGLQRHQTRRLGENAAR